MEGVTYLPEGMPWMVRLPIKTKGRPWWQQIKTWLFEPKIWVLVRDWPIVLRDGTRIVIPEGFRLDLASVPRVFWSLLVPTGLLMVQGIIHDYGYRYGQLPQDNGIGEIVRYCPPGAGKDYWDQLFREIGEDINGMPALDAVAWAMVKVGGQSAWDNHRSTRLAAIRPA